MKHAPVPSALRPTADQNQAVRTAVRDYLDRTGIRLLDFASRIGYGHSTLEMFLAGSYGSNSGNVLRAAEAYMAAHPIAPARPVTGPIFETENVRLLRDAFDELLALPDMFLVYAPPGSQKSFVLEHEVYKLNERELARNADGPRAYLIYVREGITPHALLARMCQACGLKPNRTIDLMLSALRDEHRRRRCLFVFDEAQHMTIPCFETVRELHDHAPFCSLLFAGSHALYFQFESQAASLGQLNSRISRRIALPGVREDEARSITEQRIGHLLPADAAKRGKQLDTIIAKCTVPDAYTSVAPGQPPATYINVRTLCKSLDNTLYRAAKLAAQKANAA